MTESLSNRVRGGGGERGRAVHGGAFGCTL